MMFGVAFSVGVLLALLGGTAGDEYGRVADDKCVAPQHLVSKYRQRMEESVKVDEKPNPSILLAMDLVGGSDEEAHKLLLHQMKEEAVNTAEKHMSSGQVALYVLALLSSCENPRQVHAFSHTVDLISILQKKTDEEVTSLEVNGVPKTTLFSVSLDILGLCLAQAGGYEEAAVALAKKMLDPEERRRSVDTNAVATLALTCTYEHTDISNLRDLLSETLLVVTTGFLNEQEKNDGMIGNIYSMGLVLQALEATREFYAPRKWNCAQAFSVVYKHDFTLPMAIAQVLPALVGKSYLDASKVACAHSASIEVHYTVINKLRGEHFSFHITVHVPEGSTLLKVLQEAEKEKPKEFSFKTEQTFWGPMVVSIHDLAANTNDKTYWQFFSGKEPLQEGVGTYKPKAGEHIEAIFSTY
ncbi:cobalamin binding intrinsic factor [Phaenicophaeus curvirostris]|uniref:cobalamin binding intrinsic factor n=1 Tax=Phaenicophaeus curvirostris TaxID=33595 RepID=UPI0037F0CD06